uniref:Uncharacterized protein n=1 Tax=Setaria digitata TaxID=48799 RepID=A0A915PMT4_9BILA
MSEVLNANYTEESMKRNARKCIRKVMIDSSDSKLVDELVKEGLSDSEYSTDQRHEKRKSKTVCSRPRHRLTTFSLRSILDSGVQNKFNITCLLCKRKFACIDARSTLLAYYICDDCMESEKEHTEELEAELLNNDKSQPVPISCTSADLNAFNHCKCQNCVRREFLNEERRKEIDILQRCWHDLRQNIRQMFRDGLNANMTSSKGKRFDVDKIKRNVTILAEKDPHQLYKRLESIGHEYVMNLKSDDLWQILVAPQVVPALIQLYEAGASEEQMELERAKLFIKTLLDRFSCQQETARNMSPLLAALDEDYLSQFGISWKVLNHHIFDRVIYQDDLLLNYLPSLENVLKCKLVVHDDENEEERRQRAYMEAARGDIPQGALELAQSFRVFHKLMVTSREIFKKASANIVLYTEQQKIINHIKRKTRGDLLKEDLEYFKSQRKVVRNCILRKGQYYQWHADLAAFGDFTDLIDEECDNSDSEVDLNVSKRLHELIEEEPAASICIDENGEVLPCVRCKRCTLRHCSCDECRISHIITCGLLIDSEDISNLIWPLSDCSDRGDGRESDSERSHRKRPLLNIKRLPNHNLRFQTARTLFTVHDQHNKKETAWGDWEVPFGCLDDIDCLDHCLCERNGIHSDFGSLNNQTDGEEEHATDSDTLDLPDGGKYQEIVKEIFDLKTKGYRMDSSKCGFGSANLPRTSVVDVGEKTDMNRENDNKHEENSSFIMKKANPRSGEKPGFTFASMSNINVKRFKMKNASNNVAGDSDGTESDCETSSTSFPGSNEWFLPYLDLQYRRKEEREKQTKMETLRMDSCHLSGPDRLLLKEITQRHYAVLSKDNAVSDLAVELFGRKAMEKPQMLHKAGLTPSVSRLIRKSKLVSDKNDTNTRNSSTVKFLSASARERLLGEVKDMDKKVRERTLLRLVQSYEGERWATRSEDYKSQVLESMKECLSKDWAREDETDFKTAAKGEKNRGSARRNVSRNSAAKIHQEKRGDREMIYIPETRTMVSFATSALGSASKKSKSSPKKMDQDDLAQLWSKQTLAAAIAKQLSEQRTILDIGKAFSIEKQKTMQTVSCKMGNHVDMTSSSTTAIDFSVDLGEFDVSTFPEEVRKLHEEGKLKKLLKQAVGLKRSKTGISAKVDCKCDDDKRVENVGGSKEELFEYQTDNVDDLTEDDDDEDTDEDWSDCEAPDEQHPHRHHSCDNKAKNRRTSSGAGRDGRHGHCDCCYCEMFGHAATDNIKSGRAQIRERLRMKLKRRSVQEHSGTDTKNLEEKLICTAANQESKNPPAVIPDAPIEQILDYINEKDNVVAQAAASKAAKRARQKLRKQVWEEKEKQEKERKLREEQKKAAEAELLKKRKEQQATQQEVKREKQNKPEAKKRKADRVRGKKQKDRERKKENGLQLSESQEVEVRKEPVLEFEYWNDSKCDLKFKRLGSTKEQSGTSKTGRAKPQNKDESKKNEGVPKRYELEEKKENTSTKKGAVEADSVLEKNGNTDLRNENNEVKSEAASVNGASAFSKTDDNMSGDLDLNNQPAVKLQLKDSKDSIIPSTDIVVSNASTVLHELVSQSPVLNCPIPELLSEVSPMSHMTVSDMPRIRPVEINNTNIPQRLPFPFLPIPPPSQTNTLGFGTYQGGVGYYTHFGGQPQVYSYLINGLNQCVVSSPNQNTAVLPAVNASFTQDPALRPLRTLPGLETRTCQIGINDPIHVSGQYSLPPPINSPLTDVLQRVGPISPLPLFDTKSIQTTTNFTGFGFQKLSLYVSEPPSLPSFSSSISSSPKPSLCCPQLSVRDLKGNTNTAHLLSPGVISSPPQNDLCSNSGGVQIFLNTNNAGQGLTLPDSSCLRQRFQNTVIPVSDLIPDSLSTSRRDLLNFIPPEQGNIDVATKLQKSSQCINGKFPVSRRNDTMNTVASGNMTTESNKVKTDGALPGSSQFTAAIRAKRNEACKTFLSSSSPLADYDSETRKLAAFAKEDEVFHNQNPMIFEPGDPRIAVAIAEMKFDPHEAFKPRPDSELEFLDPLELEVEHFKRVLWEEEQLTRPRVPLRELRKIEPENEPDAVFHFAPLV